jgi:hypothetical protein
MRSTSRQPSFCGERGLTVELASYDERMLAAARALRIPLFAL